MFRFTPFTAFGFKLSCLCVCLVMLCGATNKSISFLTNLSFILKGNFVRSVALLVYTKRLILFQVR